uniref:RRM Nup35-type domain-containing protein n=2 Tax=Mesocestoides corti TaxID=53468 RepID=A0A5K3ELK8_MESCO
MKTADFGTGILCNLCFRTLKEPYRLKCGHVFCRTPCLIPPGDVSPSVIVCPKCKISFHISSVRPDTHLASLIAETQRKQGRCELCASVSRSNKTCQHCDRNLCFLCENEHVQEVITGINAKMMTLRNARLKLERTMKVGASRGNAGGRSGLEAGINEAIRQLRLAADDALEKAKLDIVLEEAKKKEQIVAAVGEMSRLSSLVKCKDFRRNQFCDLKTLCARRDSMRQLVEDARALECTVRDVKKKNLLSDYSVAQKFTMISTQFVGFQLVIPSTNEPVNLEQLLGKPSGKKTTHKIASGGDWDVADRSLWIGNLGPSATEADLFKYFSTFGAITDVAIPKVKGKSESRGFGFVTFKETDSVAKILSSQPHFVAGTQAIVRLRINRGRSVARSDDVQEKPGVEYEKKKIIVRQLDQNTTEKDLQDYFSKFGAIKKVVIIRKPQGQSCCFGFVEFESELAIKDDLVGCSHFIGGNQVKVNMASVRGNRGQKGGDQKTSDAPASGQTTKSRRKAKRSNTVNKVEGDQKTNDAPASGQTTRSRQKAKRSNTVNKADKKDCGKVPSTSQSVKPTSPITAGGASGSSNVFEPTIPALRSVSSASSSIRSPRTLGMSAARGSVLQGVPTLQPWLAATASHSKESPKPTSSATHSNFELPETVIETYPYVIRLYGFAEFISASDLRILVSYYGAIAGISMHSHGSQRYALVAMHSRRSAQEVIDQSPLTINNSFVLAKAHSEALKQELPHVDQRFEPTIPALRSVSSASSSIRSPRTLGTPAARWSVRQSVPTVQPRSTATASHSKESPKCVIS